MNKIKRRILLLIILGVFDSCGKSKSPFVCYMCRTTVIVDSFDVERYNILGDDYTPCNIEEEEIRAYERDRNNTDTISMDYIIDTVTMCAKS